MPFGRQTQPTHLPWFPTIHHQPNLTVPHCIPHFLAEGGEGESLPFITPCLMFSHLFLQYMEIQKKLWGWQVDVSCLVEWF